MNRLRNYLRRIRLRYRPSSTLLKCVVLAAIVLSILAVVTLSLGKQNLNKEAESLRQEAATLENENQQLQDKISILGTVESIKEIACEVLGLVDSDSVVFDAN